MGVKEQGHEWQYEESVSKHSAGVDWVCSSLKSVCLASVRTRDQIPLKPCKFQVHIVAHLEFHPQRETRKSPEQAGLKDLSCLSSGVIETDTASMDKVEE